MKVIIAVDSDTKYPSVVKILDADQNPETVLKHWEMKLKGRAIMAETQFNYKKGELITNHNNLTFYPNNFCKTRNVEPLIYLKGYHQYLFQQ